MLAVDLHWHYVLRITVTVERLVLVIAQHREVIWLGCLVSADFQASAAHLDCLPRQVLQ